MNRPTLLALALLLLGAPSSAQILVPEHYSTIQQAIDNASSGDVIVVHGGTFGPIVVDKPLTLVGDPAPLLIGNGVPAAPLEAKAPVTLAGSGQGSVVLANVRVGGAVSGFEFASAQAGIQGGGFRELHVMDSLIDGPSWNLLTGVATGALAIDVDVDSLLVANSVVRGANSDSDDCYGNGPAGPTGLRAPDAVVHVFDSSVVGGGSVLICSRFGCPTQGGAGGTGIEAVLVLQSASDIRGGRGADHYDFSVSPPVLCGRAPDGPRTDVGREVVLADDLRATSDLRLGRPWSLTWDKGPCLFAAFQELQLRPLVLPIGPVFIDLLGARDIAAYGPGVHTRTLQVTNDTTLIGTRVTAQLFEFSGALSRPVTAVILP